MSVATVVTAATAVATAAAVAVVRLTGDDVDEAVLVFVVL